jgi:hypothetical protein
VEGTSGRIACQIDRQNHCDSQGNRQDRQRGSYRLAQQRPNHQPVKEKENGHVIAA